MRNDVRFTLAAFAVGFAAVVVILGPDPLRTRASVPRLAGCYGFLGVPQAAEDIAEAERLYPDAPFEADKAWPEMIHRYFAGSLGLLILHRRPGSKTGARGSPLPLTLLDGDAAGAFSLDCHLEAWPQVVTAHLLGVSPLTLLGFSPCAWAALAAGTGGISGGSAGASPLGASPLGGRSCSNCPWRLGEL